MDAATVPRPAPPPGPSIVAGLARAGRAAVDALTRLAGPEQVVAWERAVNRDSRRLQRDLAARGVRTYLRADPPVDAEPPALTFVRSPGISMESRPIRRARDAGLDIVDELELGWRLSRTPMLAITGTNGKSTVAGLATALLDGAGHRIEMVGNTDFGRPLSAVNGTPLDWAVCEVSSFQLEGCPALLPDLAVFTNLTPEHLARHRTMSRYGKAKRRMFVRGDAAVPRAVIDVDGDFGRALAQDVEARGGAVSRVGFAADADYRILATTWDLRRAVVRAATPRGELELETRLPGRYNAGNVAAALAVADMLEVDREVTAATLAEHPGTPGRFEHVDAGQDFSVIVDFAHTPDGIEQFLGAVRAALRPGARLRTVFGVAGRSTTDKLRASGRAAREGSDHVVFTCSGFRGEPPLVALQGQLQGAREANGADIEIVLDRRRAMARAIAAARPGDAVVIVGRGPYALLTTDPRGIPQSFDDRVVARELLTVR
jgi:UDP-N-acetylmuramoyl-L-alanyl-D-glutamate--2,6-diaminopimelate ligase